MAQPCSFLQWSLKYHAGACLLISCPPCVLSTAPSRRTEPLLVPQAELTQAVAATLLLEEEEAAEAEAEAEEAVEVVSWVR